MLTALFCVGLSNVLAQGGAGPGAAPSAPSPLVFTSIRDGTMQVFRIDAAGGREVKLSQGSNVDMQPTWSSQGRIAFVSYRTGAGDIYTMNADGGDIRRLSAHPGLEQSPAWSPDGRRIAYVGAHGAGAAVWVVNDDGSGEQVISGKLIEVGAPQWSPDGSRIAFSAAIDHKSRVVVANLATGEVGPVTDGTGGEVGPTWSPDGRSILYVHSGSRTEGVGLRLLRWGETQPRMLTSNGYTNSQPQFSPDGTKVLYLSNASTQGARMNVHVINVDGTEPTNLTHWEHADMGATWSSDGRQIFFASFKDWPGQIYRMNADGSDVRRLTESKFQDSYPVSRPTRVAPAAVASKH
ncbi:MAG: LpqB family beta-propeller domain-containing protein [Rubrivivax sp.]|nr:LpqB family beta-propeller domain-containing protein [Rubrivivax sp.]MDP3083086.1 LpqB family beta-propeller domain-containing protein [Rubrivivax sp.]